MNIRARHGAIYFITFIDDFTRYGYVYLISHKSEALSCFVKFMNLVENQLDRKIKALRTDRGREYLSDEFKQLCDEKGIQRQLTIPYTPQQNGVAERQNRTLLEMVRSMMAQAKLPIIYWGDALLTAAFGYVFIGEQDSGKVTELESRDVIFLENDFPKQGEIGHDLSLYETTDHIASAVNTQIILDESHSDDNGYVPITTNTPSELSDFDIACPSGSNLPIDRSIYQSQPRRMSRQNIPRRRFEIEGEAFIVTPQDEEETRNVNEALTCNGR
uniref:Uncharacterized protein LOC104232161 n=1 Tax=Nicotiana sylvestris TaxID=4096 RepID=A0A1U7WUK3_NICSY|nr:PREDICTED: uncharacterized protein LOC104232161 [Nicotiana sylvestris]